VKAFLLKIVDLKSEIIPKVRHFYLLYRLFLDLSLEVADRFDGSTFLFG
jgi:hypothetical protein